MLPKGITTTRVTSEGTDHTRITYFLLRAREFGFGAGGSVRLVCFYYRKTA